MGVKRLVSADSDSGQLPGVVVSWLNDNLDIPSGTATAAAQPLNGALTRLRATLTANNDATPTTVRIIGLGSSVGNAASLPDPATQAPVVKLAQALSPALNPLSNVNITTTNGSVDGSSMLAGTETHYPAAKTAAGGAPNLLVLAYGMNDGMPGAYHVGQTFPAVYLFGKKLVEQAQSEGADVVIFTTPHPNTDYMTDAMWKTPGSPTYPGATAVPADTKAGSTVQVRNSDGVMVPASYRHLRVNEVFRRIAAETGAVLVDVEKYWFKAVAKYGLGALFNANEYAHPNLLGHQSSYWAAIDELSASYTKASLAASPKPAGFAPNYTYRVDSTTRASTTTLAEDNQLSFNAAPNQVWEVEIGVFFTGTAGDLRVGMSLPSGAVGRIGGIAAAPNSTGVESGPSTHRSVALPDTYGLPVGANDADAFALVKGIIRIGATGGTIKPMWSQDTSSSSATTVYRDTWMRAQRLV